MDAGSSPYMQIQEAAIRGPGMWKELSIKVTMSSMSRSIEAQDDTPNGVSEYLEAVYTIMKQSTVADQC